MWSLTFLVPLAGLVQAHFHYPKLVVDGVADSAQFVNTRQTNAWSEGNPVGDIRSYNFRCNQAKPGSGNRTVTAGSTLGFQASPAVAHNGPLQFYMAKAPDGVDLNTWEATGDVWFKTGSLVATGPDPVGVPFGDYEPLWPATRSSLVSFKVPKATPNGYYLVRAEFIAVDRDSQYYIGCGQVYITGGGNGTPGPLVAFPGAYKVGDPGLTYKDTSVYNATWKAPGPPVWTG